MSFLVTFVVQVASQTETSATVALYRLMSFNTTTSELTNLWKTHCCWAAGIQAPTMADILNPATSWKKSSSISLWFMCSREAENKVAPSGNNSPLGASHLSRARSTLGNMLSWNRKVPIHSEIIISTFCPPGNCSSSSASTLRTSMTPSKPFATIIRFANCAMADASMANTRMAPARAQMRERIPVPAPRSNTVLPRNSSALSSTALRKAAIRGSSFNISAWTWAVA
mmetsp:Transcript_30871/g.67730  ORF Transcript_30871/g.67730 Transcript_30871/m.67730 type:complete len:227 (-) Transcript_30871:124-804(-)